MFSCRVLTTLLVSESLAPEASLTREGKSLHTPRVSLTTPYTGSQSSTTSSILHTSGNDNAAKRKRANSNTLHRARKQNRPQSRSVTDDDSAIFDDDAASATGGDEHPNTSDGDEDGSEDEDPVHRYEHMRQDIDDEQQVCTYFVLDRSQL